MGLLSHFCFLIKADMTRHVLSHAFFDNYQRAPSHPELAFPHDPEPARSHLQRPVHNRWHGAFDLLRMQARLAGWRRLIA